MPEPTSTEAPVATPAPKPVPKPVPRQAAEPAPRQSTSDIEDSFADMLHPGEPDEEPVAEDVDDDYVDDEPEDPDATPVAEGDDDSDEVEIEFEGQLITAPKVVADALMRTKDYTEKTQAVAAQRKQVEVMQGEVKMRAEQFEFAQLVQPEILQVQQYDAEVASYRDYLRNNVDGLSAVEVTKLQMAIQDKREERENLVQSMRNKQFEFQQAQEHHHKELLTKGTEVLRQAIPGWGKQQQESVRAYATQVGFTESELGGVTDPRQVLTLWKAAQYDALKSGAVPAVKKVQAAPTIKAKSRNPMSQEKGQELNLRKKLKNPTRSDKQKAVDLEDHFADRLFR